MRSWVLIKRKTTFWDGDTLGDQCDAKRKQVNGAHTVVFMQDCTWFLTFE